MALLFVKIAWLGLSVSLFAADSRCESVCWNKFPAVQPFMLLFYSIILVSGLIL